MLTQPSARPSRRGALFFFLAVAGAVAVVLIAGVALGFLDFGTRTVDRSQPAVLVQLTNLSEYHASSASFQVVVDLENDTKYLPDFLSGERSSMVAAGTVDASVDFSGLEDDNIIVSNGGDTVTITLPAPYLDDVVLDHDKTYVQSRQRGLLDRLGGVFSGDAGDDQPLYQAATVKLHDAAATSELRVLAEDNTRSMLEALMTSAGFDEVVVVFEEPPQSLG